MIESPHYEEMEQATIGSVLINPQAFYELRGQLKADDFYFLKHSYIWQAMERLIDSNTPIDNLTLSKELQAANHLDMIGGDSYLTHLIAYTPDSTKAGVYSRMVKNLSSRRRLMQAADEIRIMAADEMLSTEDVFATAQSKIIDAVSTNTTQDTTWKEEVNSFFESMLQVWENPNKTLGIPTGHKAFDRYTLGLQKKWLTYIVGRPGMGKTVVLLQWALNAARAGYKVGFWTGEMAFDQLVKRAICNVTQIPNHYINNGSLGVDVHGLTPEQAYEKLQPVRRKFQDAEQLIAGLPIVGKWDKEGITPQELKMNVLKAQATTGLDILFVDYADLMTSGQRKKDDTQESTAISKALKGIANSCNIPIVAGQQLNRAVEGRMDKRPLLSDIRNSGSFEQDGDLVIALYRDEIYNEATETPGMIELILRKNRHGGTPTFYGKFNGATSTIKETDLRRFNTGV